MPCEMVQHADVLLNTVKYIIRFCFNTFPHKYDEKTGGVLNKIFKIILIFVRYSDYCQCILN